MPKTNTGLCGKILTIPIIEHFFKTLNGFLMIHFSHLIAELYSYKIGFLIDHVERGGCLVQAWNVMPPASRRAHLRVRVKGRIHHVRLYKF